MPVFCFSKSRRLKAWINTNESRKKEENKYTYRRGQAEVSAQWWNCVRRCIRRDLPADTSHRRYFILFTVEQFAVTIVIDTGRRRRGTHVSNIYPENISTGPRRARKRVLNSIISSVFADWWADGKRRLPSCRASFDSRLWLDSRSSKSNLRKVANFSITHAFHHTLVKKKIDWTKLRAGTFD